MLHSFQERPLVPAGVAAGPVLAGWSRVLLTEQPKPFSRSSRGMGETDKGTQVAGNK